MEELISVIVPVYKVEKFLNKCVDSVINQTYQNLEIILVDDGSPDNCGKICDEYAEKDARIKVIHKENGGLSSARNAGLDVFSGEYVFFADSDDYLLPETLEKTYHALKKSCADVCVCNFQEIDEKGNTLQCFPYCELLGDKEYSSKEIMKEINVRFVVVWGKLYAKKIFDNLRFVEGVVHEDEYFVHRMLEKSKKLVSISFSGYMYLQREGSITHDENIKGLIDAFGGYEDRIICFIENGHFELIPQLETLLWLKNIEIVKLGDTSMNKRYLKLTRKIRGFIPFKKRLKWIYLYFPTLFKKKVEHVN